MRVLQSKIRSNDPDFIDRAGSFSSLCQDLSTYRAMAVESTEPKSRVRTRRQGKLLVEERLDLLIDRSSAVLEIAPLAGLDVYPGLPPGAAIRCLIASVSGQTCVIIANNPAVKGGTYFPLTIKKHLRAQAIALEQRLPCIYVVDSGGAYLPLQSEVFPDHNHFGRIFYNQAQLAKARVPQIAVVVGSCTAGGAYVPAMSDEVFMVGGQSNIFLGGPPLVRAATREDITAEELGGAEIHTTKSGVADAAFDNEQEALLAARHALTRIGQAATVSVARLTPDSIPEPPRYDPKELGGIVGVDLRRAIPAEEILARLLDDSRFDEFKSKYGTTLRCGFGRIMGFLVGIVANDGILYSEAALKATHFIQLCSQRYIPLVFLQNIVGFMVGKHAEHGGIAKDGAKMVNAVATARVPKFTLIFGASYGAGNYAMCGRAYNPEFLFAWPNARTSVMGGQQAAQVLLEIRGKNAAEAKEDEASTIIEKYERESSAFYSTARLWDDGLITPEETRHTLALAFASTRIDMTANNEFGIFRM